MVFRDYDEPEEPTQNNSDQNDSSTNSPQTNSGEQEETIQWLENGRKATLASLVLVCIAECLVLAGMRLRATLRAILFTGMVASFLVVMPATYVLDLAGNEDDSDDDEGEQSTIADETFVAQTEQGSMAHEQTEIDTSFLFTGIRFDMSFSGYDLGLVEPENYSAVRDDAPDENDTDAKSYVEFHSQLDLKYGKNIPSMFLLPSLWFFFPAKPKSEERKHSLIDEQE